MRSGLIAAATIAIVTLAPLHAGAQGNSPISSGPEYEAFSQCVTDQYLTGDYNSLALDQTFSRIMKKCPFQMVKYTDKCEDVLSSDAQKEKKCLMMSYILVGLLMKK